MTLFQDNKILSQKMKCLIHSYTSSRARSGKSDCKPAAFCVRSTYTTSTLRSTSPLLLRSQSCRVKCGKTIRVHHWKFVRLPSGLLCGMRLSDLSRVLKSRDPNLTTNSQSLLRQVPSIKHPILLFRLQLPVQKQTVYYPSNKLLFK